MPEKEGRVRQARPALLALVDAALIGAALVVFALFDHVLPRRLEVRASQAHLELAEQAEAEDEEHTLGAHFTDKFSQNGSVWTENSYSGKNLAVFTSQGQWGESVYYLQDIYVRDVEYLRTAFGQDTFGKGHEEDILTMAERKSAVAAINGDYYSVGVMNAIIRNGEVYWDAVDPFESLLALYRDGSMEVLEGGGYTVAGLLEKGAWQTWSFGPSLLDENGRAKTEFEMKNPEPNPRTVIGMVEPGHYMFLVVDGRLEGYSEGATYEELAQLCEWAGMKLAYNLDGGGSTKMVFGRGMVNRPSRGRELSDIIYVVEEGVS